MAAILRAVAWIDDAQAAVNGYLTITVTPEALTEVAVRVAEAGPACARSDALAGTRVAAPPGTPLTAAHSWPEARSLVIAQVTARLATAAGATVTVTDDHDAGRAQPRASLPSWASPLPGAERARPHTGLPLAPTPVVPDARAHPCNARAHPRNAPAHPRDAHPRHGRRRLRRAGRNHLRLGPYPPGTAGRSRPGRVGAARSGQSRLCCSLRALLRCVDAALGRCP